MDSGYLESYVWIYAHASKLDQGVVFDSFAVVTIKNTVWRWSNKLILFENTKTSASTSNIVPFNNSVWKKRIFEKVMFNMKWSNFICISGIVIWIFWWYQIE